jgi:hypothetical protein
MESPIPPVPADRSMPYPRPRADAKRREQGGDDARRPPTDDAAPPPTGSDEAPPPRPHEDGIGEHLDVTA